ncbi:MAG: hypothetical protein K6G17_07375 [Oscillospiraceae bacterium]|nr:hypothetical protein [Oscillospiraceae bacterium]
MNNKAASKTPGFKKALGVETFVFPLVFAGVFALFAVKMGLGNAINTMMNTAYRLLIDTVLYLTAICVLMGAISALLSEFGFVSLINRLLRPLMKPIYGLPGAAALGVVTTFLSDNPAILALADDHQFRRCFKAYQFPALTNLGTAFGMGLIVCSFMYGLSGRMPNEKVGLAVILGLVGAIIGSIVSTRLMLIFTKKRFGPDAPMEADENAERNIPAGMRPVREGNVGSRVMAAILEGGHGGVKMGVSIVPGVLVICTLVMMLTNGCPEGGYTGAAYEGIKLLPWLASKIDFLLSPLFGFSTPDAIGVPVTALGAAGAALGVTSTLVDEALIHANDIAVFTAMCMCWSGYLSTHTSMMDSLNCKELIGKAILCHTVGGLLAGVSAHWLFVLLSALL